MQRADEGCVCGGTLLRLLVRVVRVGGGLVCKAHRPLYHSTLGSKVMKKKKRQEGGDGELRPWHHRYVDRQSRHYIYVTSRSRLMMTIGTYEFISGVNESQKNSESWRTQLTRRLGQLHGIRAVLKFHRTY